MKNMTFAQVEEQLVEAVRLCWRQEPGRWPFASDGPWHLVREENDMDEWRRRQELADAAAKRPLPPSREEMALRDEALRWLAAHVTDRDRRIVVLALKQLAGGAKRVSWAKLRLKLTTGPGGLEFAISDRGLGARYNRAVSSIARALDRRAHP